MPSQPEEASQPKLFLHKPSKATLKKNKAKGGPALSHSPPPGSSRPVGSMDPSSSSSTEGTAAELAPKKPFLRRIFPFLLVVNFAVGAYVLLRTTEKKSAEKEEEDPVKKGVSSNQAETSKPEAPQQLPLPRPEAPKVALPPVPESRQRELFKWILEEKRKVKPGSPAEKKKLNEEKALLKKYIRAESIPNL